VTLRPEFSLGVAGGDDGGSPSQTAQGGGRFKAQFPCPGCQEIANFVCFEMAPHVLDRIEFRRVSRQAFQDDALSGRGDVLPDQQAAMDSCAVPQDEKFAGDVPLQVPEKLNDLRALDAALVDLKVKPPQGQAADQRKTFPAERLLQHGSLPARRPGADARGPGAQPAFIDENDGSSLLAGLFFSAGHCTRRQRRMACSSRSTARRSGRWQLKPLAPINRQT